MFDAGKKPDGTPYRIGVIDLPSFYRDMEAERRGDPDFKSTTRDVRDILDDFHKQGRRRRGPRPAHATAAGR